MLTILNKFVWLIAIGVIAYLTYTALSEDSLNLVTEGEKIPVISKEMLNPVLIEPRAYSSPVNRDPFVIGGDSELDSSALGATRQIADSNNSADSVGKLMGIVIGDDGHRLALIDGQIHRIGSLVELADSNEPWQIDSIEDNSVILRSDGQQTILKISNIYSDYNDFYDVEEDIMEAERREEYTQ